jgi:molybdate transport system ATP-binding protein
VTAGLDTRVQLGLGGLDLDVDLRADAGETIAVLGPNGAGKTTLLRALAGLQGLASGHVVVGGAVWEDTARGIHVDTAARPVGVVFQDYLLFPHLSVLDNVAFGLRCRQEGRAAARRRALEWLERIGLADYGSARPRELSGGQAQRVALARALATEPPLLLLDEPLAALDATARASTRRDLRRHLATYPGVTVLVTHDPLEAASLADRLVVLEAGQVTQSGTAAEISARPRSRYVADLVGVNVLRGTAAGGHIEIAGGHRLTAPDAATGDVFAVIHPRAVALHRQAPEGTPRNVWEGRVASVDDEGERVRVRVTGAVPIVAEVTPAAVDALGLVEGAPVWVSVKATEISLFPV